MPLLIVFIAIFVFTIFGAIYFAPSNLKVAFTFAPFMATPTKAIKKALALANIKPNELLFDLGSGTGKALLIGEKKYKARGVGFEFSTPFFIISKINLFLNRSKRIKIFHKNFLEADLKTADVIFMFLTPKAFGLLENKIKNELKPGARIVTFSSPLLFFEPTKTELAPNKKVKIYLYEI